MTEGDKRQEKAMLLLEHQEADESLAITREKAKRWAGRLEELQRWLTNAQSYGATYYEQKDWRDFNSRIRSDPAYRDALNWDKMVEFVDELLAATKKVSDLAQRKKELGLK